ncbi:hypothetical protein ENSA7_42240 [Enhygromyxa salina]|uniref:Uncharacterized protein n=1 Tax=Enhygromyxa salina TaxID=215803 RepID=A0A2S9YLW1_9BACT|nr:hypothetical protein ENSA7_42240 [Enhygromyxa salina]
MQGSAPSGLEVGRAFAARSGDEQRIRPVHTALLPFER